MIDKVIELTSYNDYLRTYDEENYDQRLLNIVELKNMAATYDDLYTLVCDLVTQKADENTKDNVRKSTILFISVIKLYHPNPVQNKNSQVMRHKNARFFH